MLDPEAAEQVCGDLGAVGGGGAQIIERSVVASERLRGGFDGGLAPRPADERGFRLRRAGGDAGHAAEGNAGFGDNIVRNLQEEGAANR